MMNFILYRIDQFAGCVAIYRIWNWRLKLSQTQLVDARLLPLNQVISVLELSR